MIGPMLIVAILLCAWLTVNVALLAAVAVANHRGQHPAADRVVASRNTTAPVISIFARQDSALSSR